MDVINRDSVQFNTVFLCISVLNVDNGILHSVPSVSIHWRNKRFCTKKHFYLYNMLYMTAILLIV